MQSHPERIVLRNLPASVRLVLCAFLVSVGIGYFTALVQLHFQHASAGELLPGKESITDIYTGRQGTTELERLLIADESRPFASGGTMRPAFTSKSAGWTGAIKRRARKDKVDEAEAERRLRIEREAERLALLDWLHAGAKEETYTSHPLPQDFAATVGLKESHDESLLQVDDSNQWTANVQSIIDIRCARCHAAEKGGAAGQIHLEEWAQVKDFCEPAQGSAVSLTSLAQSTHVHLLGFSMLYGLTGVIFAFSSYPGLVRFLIAPLPLIAQIADIACWWLARLDPFYAHMIIYTGGVVAGSLALHILLSLWDMGKSGKLIFLLVLVGAALAGWQLKERIIDPYLEQHARTTATSSP